MSLSSVILLYGVKAPLNLLSPYREIFETRFPIVFQWENLIRLSPISVNLVKIFRQVRFLEFSSGLFQSILKSSFYSDLSSNILRKIRVENFFLQSIVFF